MRSSFFCTVVLFFSRLYLKHRINILHLFIYVIIIIIIIFIIIISLLLVFELNDKLTYRKLFLQSSRYLKSFQ